MPQKKNPFALTHIRGVANKMIGVLASVTASARTPSGQPDNRLLIYGELPEAMQTVNNAVELMTEVLQEISFNTNRGKALAESGWILATDLAETLVQECGLSFRSAHQLVAFLASEYQGKSILELDHETLSHFGEIVLGQPVLITKNQLKIALDASHAIQARTEPGGTTIHCMNNMIAECRERLESYQEKNQSNKVYFAARQHDLLERAMKEVSNAQTNR